MRTHHLAILLGTSFLLSGFLLSGGVAAQPADLCRELLAYAEKKAAEPPKEEKSAQAGRQGGLRNDNHGSGTQGGGSSNSSTSSDTSEQKSAAPAAPVSTGAAAEAASSGHAAGQAGNNSGPTLAGGVTIQQVRETSGRGDRQACRETAQIMRRAGADMPAALLALAAYEPRQQN